MLRRGINNPEKTPNKNKILASDELTAKIAGTWKEGKDAIEAVILARTLMIRDYLVEEAIPEEVVIQREIILTLEAVLHDFQEYADEQDRRDKAKRGDAPKEGKPK